jgi:hypothetical protein
VWPALARAAAVELHGAEADVESVGVSLLRAIKVVFDAKGTDRLLTADLLVALIDREGEPWAEWWGQDVERAREKDGAPRGSAAKLAAMLRPFDVQPGEVRTPDGGKGKGYKLEDFADAFERYVASESSERRDNATTVAAQGFEVSHRLFDAEGVATAEALGAQGLSRCRDLGTVSSRDGDSSSRAETVVLPPAVREPGEEG